MDEEKNDWCSKKLIKKLIFSFEVVFVTENHGEEERRGEVRVE